MSTSEKSGKAAERSVRERKKVMVAMSGGVDSSVACALLKEEGFEVIGVTLRLFNPGDKISCCGADESAEKAKEVCARLGIKHYLKDARKYFSKYVVDEFTASYLAGRTPNPCVECNRFLKFDYLFELARGMDIPLLATGHYAVLETRGGQARLMRGKDENKDQSYFLYCIKKERLNSLLFPLGGLKKDKVREIAASYGLPAAREKESKDICFIPEGDYSLWMKNKGYVSNKPGYIKDSKGKILGRHNGYFNFTIGQRRNLGVSSSERLYVTELKPGTNEVFVSRLEDAYFRGFSISELNWLGKDQPSPDKKYSVQIRYRHKPCAGRIEKLAGGSLVFRFSKKQFAVAAGQSAVFYEGDRVLGGGIIEEAVK